MSFTIITNLPNRGAWLEGVEDRVYVSDVEWLEVPPTIIEDRGTCYNLLKRGRETESFIRGEGLEPVKIVAIPFLRQLDPEGFERFLSEHGIPILESERDKWEVSCK